LQHLNQQITACRKRCGVIGERRNHASQVAVSPLPYVPRHQAQSILKTQVFKKQCKRHFAKRICVKKSAQKKIVQNNLQKKNPSLPRKEEKNPAQLIAHFASFRL
jgi:hypothetical protein